MKNYVMQLLIFGLLLSSCSSDDNAPPPEEAPMPVVTTSDITLSVSEAAQVGDVIGEVPGTSDQGAVTFSISSQTPSGVFTVGADSGEVTVADISALDVTVNPQIVLEVEVRKDAVVKTSTVTVDVLDACLSQFNPEPGDWKLILFDTFATGWGGAFMTVNIDGDITEYTNTDEPIVEIIISIPEGTERLIFNYTASDSADEESEHIFVIQSPGMVEGEAAFEDGPNPTPGELCFDGFEQEMPPEVELRVCNDPNFENPAGDWTLELSDLASDSWDEAFITVTIDGVETFYSLAPGIASETFIVSVPDGTQTLTFDYIPGFFEQEHIYKITYPDGSLAISDGPNPVPGEICPELATPPPPPCMNTNFAAFTGDWIFELADVYSDGWDGALFTVTIDGTATDYTMANGLATESFTINVPDGAQTVTFDYIPGAYEEEHSFTLTSPDGTFVIEDGPLPTSGLICADM